MKALKTQLTLLFAAVLLTGCNANKANDGDSMNDAQNVTATQTSVESGLTALVAVADDQSNASFAENRTNFKFYAFQAKNELWPAAWAEACGRAVEAACVNGVRGASYANCTLPYSGRSLSGGVTLTYSNSSCLLSANGQSVQRTYNVQNLGLLGGTLSVSSDVHQDYRGTNLGGGGKLSKTSAGWDLEVLGKRKIFTRRNRMLYDISIRTTSPLSVTGSLSRSSRVINGGSFEVIHNLAKFTATYTPNNLTFSNVCCHPISGSMNVSYTGSITGSGSVTFNGCGSASLQKDGLSEEIALNYCE